MVAKNPRETVVELDRENQMLRGRDYSLHKEHTRPSASA
jgi:hypothetical protein